MKTKKIIGISVCLLSLLYLFKRDGEGDNESQNLPQAINSDTQEPDYYKGITIPFGTSKTGVVDICFINTIQPFIDINGILVISGSYQAGNIGGTSIAVSSNYSGLTSNILVASPANSLLHNNVVILSQEDGAGKIKVRINFGSYNYTGSINVRFYGNGNLTTL